MLLHPRLTTFVTTSAATTLLGVWLLVDGCTLDVPQGRPATLPGEVAFYDNPTLRRLRPSHDSLVFRAEDWQVRVSRITYATQLPDGSPVQASGVVYVPSRRHGPPTPYPLLSYQHPTAYSDSETPSGQDFGRLPFSFPLYFALHGYVVACPDYVGYGASAGQPHPYEHRQSLAQATVDMLRATQAFLQKHAIPSNGQLFLAGYSEGGYASLATQQLIERQYARALPLTAASCGAGPYDATHFFGWLTQPATTLGGSAANHAYVWQTLSYNDLYDLRRPVRYYFRAPYADQLTQSMASARQLAVDFRALCTDAFRAEVQDPTSAFGRALADNDLTRQAVQTPTLLVHGETDEVIPLLTTTRTYDALRRLGSANLHLAIIPQSSHLPTEPLFMHRSLRWFEQHRR